MSYHVDAIGRCLRCGKRVESSAGCGCSKGPLMAPGIVDTAKWIAREADEALAAKDAEIRRLREALAASEAGAAELREACENMLYVMAHRGRLDDGDWATTKALVGNALSSNDAGKRVLEVVEAAREWAGIGPDGEQRLLDALDAVKLEAKG